MSVLGSAIDYIRSGGGLWLPFKGTGIDRIQQRDANKEIGIKLSMDDFLRVAQRRARVSNPIAPGQADIVNWVLYDRKAYAVNTATDAILRLFTIPVGTSNKTFVDTNLTQVSKLEDPQWFNATGLGIYFRQNLTPTDLDAYLNATYLEFVVGSKVYIQGPLQVFPGGAGTFGNTTAANTTANTTTVSSFLANGWPANANIYDLRLPAGINLGSDGSGGTVMSDGLIGVTILQGQTFRVDLKQDGGTITTQNNNTTPFPGQGLTVASYLHGVLSRGVQ